MAQSKKQASTSKKHTSSSKKHNTKQQPKTNPKPIILGVLGIILVVAVLFIVYNTSTSPEVQNQSNEQFPNDIQQNPEPKNTTPEPQEKTYELTSMEQELFQAINNQRQVYRKPEYQLNKNLSKLTKQYHEISLEQGEAAAKVEIGTLSQRADKVGGEYVSLRENVYDIDKEKVSNGNDILDELSISALYEEEFEGIALSVIETDSTYSVIIDIYQFPEE